METTIGKAVSTLSALDEIRGQRISRSKAKEVFELRKRLVESYEFFMEQLNEALERIGLSMNENGEVKFEDDIQKALFMTEIKDIEATATTIEMEKIDLSGEDITISEHFCDATQDFVII